MPEEKIRQLGVGQRKINMAQHIKNHQFIKGNWIGQHKYKLLCQIIVDAVAPESGSILQVYVPGFKFFLAKNDANGPGRTWKPHFGKIFCGNRRIL